MHSTHCFTRIAPLSVVFALMVALPGEAQVDNPVYVDDSPQAWELFRQAQDQTEQNAGEAVRLYQELLDDFAMKLIPASEAAGDQFKAVRQRVLQDLMRHQPLLERYRTMQTPLAEQLLAADELEQLAMTRSLTEPGIEALLRLAQMHVEAGRFQMALSYLRQAQTHPDCTGRRAVHALFMIGMARGALGDTQAAQSALSQLRAIAEAAGPPAEAHACVAQLEKLLDTGLVMAESSSPSAPSTVAIAHPKSTSASISTFGALLAGNNEVNVASAEDLNDVVAQTIWSRPLDDSLARRRSVITQDDQPFSNASESPRRADRTADLTTSVPTVSGEIVYVNEGHTIRAINRLTGQQLWQCTNLTGAAISDREALASLDVNVVAVSPGAGGSVVTLTGYAQPGGRSESGRLISIDAQTGTTRRSANFIGLVDAATNEQLFPHGVPIIADGMIFVAARRTSMQSMTSAYVVALDLETLEVKWVRYITSSGGLQARIRPFCTLVYHDGALYMASAVGATAKIDPATGETLWLHRFSTPISIALADQVRRPWELGGPVVTRRGVLAIEPDQRHIMLLDAQTGSPLASIESGTAGGWNQPRYLLANDDMVFAIGSELRAFALDDLETMVWRLPDGPRLDSATDPAAPERAPSQALDIRGRVQLIADALIVPTTEGIVVVNAETGEVVNRIPIQPTGNPLAIESQLLVAAGDRLDAYMSFSKAERMLRERIVQSPAQPEPALSLVRLAMRVRQLPLALEAADLAMRAIDRASVEAAPPRPGVRSPADSRTELLSLLLDIADSQMAQSSGEGELLFGAIDAAANEPQQRVEYLLAYGQWLSDQSLNRAVETYQAILSNRVLAESWRVRDGVMRPASAWARERLSDLIARRGQTVYAPQADFAALRLKQAMGANPAEADPAQLLALAEEFPYSEAALQATLQAATNLTASGRHRAAAAGLLSLYRANPTSEAAKRLLGKLVSVCTGAGWTAQTFATIRHAATAHGEISLVTDSGSLNTTTWLASRSERRLPVIGNGKARPDQSDVKSPVITGSVVEPYRFNSSASDSLPPVPADRVLVRAGDAIRLFSPDLNQPLWTTTLPGPAQVPQVLAFNQNDVLLWLKSDPQDPKAVMLNAADGTVRWTTPRLSELLTDPVRDLRRTRGMEQMPDGDPFDPAQTLPLMNDQFIIFVQRTGGVVSMDMRDGNRVRWVKKQTLEQVHFAALHDAALVLAGMVREPGADGGSPALVPRILAIDPATGDVIHDETSFSLNLGRTPLSGVKWMRITPMGQLVYGTAGGLHSVDLYSGKRLWSSSAYPALDSQRGWHFDSGAGVLIVEDQRNRLRSVDLRDGTISDAFEVPLRGEWDPLELRSLQMVGGRAIALYPQRVVVYDPATGVMVGSDVVSDDRDYRFLLPAEGALVLVNSRATQAPLADQPGRRAQQWEYLVYVLSENGKVLAEPMKLNKALTERVQQATLIDGWLLLSTSADSVAVSLK